MKVPLILGVVALAAMLLMAGFYPKTRRYVAAVLGVVALGLIAQFQLNDREGPVELSPTDVTLSDLSYTVDPRLTTMAGRITNAHPELTLAQVTIDARLFDCPTEDADLATCSTIGQTSQSIAVDVPPGQTRAISAPLRFTNLPPMQGTMVREVTLTSARSR